MELSPLMPANYDIAPEHLKETLRNKSATKQKEAAQDFEAVFIQMALKSMRPELEGGIFQHGLADDVFSQFMEEAISKEIAKSPNNFGLADSVQKQNFE